MHSRFAASFAEAARLLGLAIGDEVLQQGLQEVAHLLEQAFRNDNKVLVCGNGGSMADAMHFAEEWTGRFKRDRKPYPALALSDPTHMSCTSNDYGFEHVFERGVLAFGQSGDLLFLLSTSGESANLFLAAQAARERGIKTIGFLGKGGGRLKSMCDLALNFPGDSSDRIQELHMLSLHALIETVEEALHG